MPFQNHILVFRGHIFEKRMLFQIKPHDAAQFPRLGIGEFHLSVLKDKNGIRRGFDQLAVFFFGFDQGFFGFFEGIDIFGNRQDVGLPVEDDDIGGNQPGANTAVLDTETGFQIANGAGSIEHLHQVVALPGIRPDVDLFRCFSDHRFLGMPGEQGKPFIYHSVDPIAQPVEGHGIRADGKGGLEQGVAELQSAFGLFATVDIAGHANIAGQFLGIVK